MIPRFWSFHVSWQKVRAPPYSNSDKGILPEKLHHLNLLMAIYVLLLLQGFSIISSEIAGK